MLQNVLLIILTAILIAVMTKDIYVNYQTNRERCIGLDESSEETNEEEE